MPENIHPEKPIFEYSEITKLIYIGTNQCCSSHFKKSLIKKGVRADISLEEMRLDQPFGVGYYLWLPTKDHKAPAFKQLLIGANFIKKLVDNEVKVYVHCEHGHARAPTLVAAYFILEGKTAIEAIKLIKRKRPIIHPNRSQIQSLINFEEMVQNGKARN
ncbi:dual specificity protein phosphatase family protein [Candidatus Woesearchaeota archaeon]|nr:dual specificity protein phosphatase family protein [Candidatus Woesearchaeota archaeon]